MGRRPCGYTLYLDRSGRRTAGPLTEEIGAADTWPELRAMARAAECFESGDRLWARDEARGHRLSIEQLREDTDPHEVAGEFTACERDTLRAADEILQRHGRPRILPGIERDTKSASTDEITRALEWLFGNDTGLSSRTIAGVMLDLPPAAIHYPSVPYDARDLGRCLRLAREAPRVAPAAARGRRGVPPLETARRALERVRSPLRRRGPGERRNGNPEVEATDEPHVRADHRARPLSTTPPRSGPAGHAYRRAAPGHAAALPRTPETTTQCRQRKDATDAPEHAC